jgi:hypothetical protein
MPGGPQGVIAVVHSATRCGRYTPPGLRT